MKLQNIVWIVMAATLMMPLAYAVTLEDALLNSTWLNTTIAIDGHINVTEAYIGSGSFKFVNMSYSNPARASSELLTINITHQNRRYTELDLPYYSHSDPYVKKITSGLSANVTGSLTFDVANCFLTNLYYDAPGVGGDKSITSFLCKGNKITINLTSLAPGVTTIFSLTSATASNCSGNYSAGNISLEFSIYDEDFPASYLNATAEVELNYWNPYTSAWVYNYTIQYAGGHTYYICLDNAASILASDLYIKYNTTGGFVHRYILVNNTLTAASPQNISAYNFHTTTGVTDLRITVRKISNYQYYPDIIVKLQRRYTSEGVWRTVQMDKSGDFGLAFFNIREESADYRIIFTDMFNNILKTTDTLKFSCTSGVCDLTVLLDPYSSVPAASTVITSYTYNNDTGMLNVVWSDPLSGTSTVQAIVTQDTVTGLLYLCDVSQTGSAGTIPCNLSSRTGAVNVKLKANGATVLTEWLQLQQTKLGNIIGNNEGAVWAVFIIIICLMFGIFSPVGAIISMVIGLIAIYFLGIFTPITVTFIIIASVIGIVIGFKVRS